MKTIKFLLMAVVVALAAACSNDDVDTSRSIFQKGEAKADSTAFDKWLRKNFADPYNIRFDYLYIDQNSDMSYNVSPADIKKSIALAKIIKHVWLDAYTELMGPDFLKQHCFREFQLIGSAEYTSNGSIVLGFAEGGIRVNLFQVNALDPAHIYIEQTTPYGTSDAFDLNRAYFHTMHHEFAHILTQLKDYSTDFRGISAGKYHTADWVNVKDLNSGAEGFVTGYASSEYNEDFAEVFSCHVAETARTGRHGSQRRRERQKGHPCQAEHHPHLPEGCVGRGHRQAAHHRAAPCKRSKHTGSGNIKLRLKL